MADITIPQIKRNEAPQSQSVGRDTLQMRDTSMSARKANDAIVEGIGKPVMEYVDKQQKMQEATDKFNSQSMINKDQITIDKDLAQFKAIPAGMRTIEQAENLRNKITTVRKSVMEDPDIPDRVKSLYRSMEPELEVRKLKEVEGAFALSETIRAGQVQAQTIELAKKNVSENSILLDPRNPKDGFALIDQQLEKIKDVKNSPFTSTDSEGNPIWSKQQSDLNIQKNVSQALTETIKRQIGVGEIEKAKVIFEQYKDQISADQIDNMQTIIQRNEEKTQVDGTVRALRHLAPDDSTKALNQIKDDDIREKVEGKLYSVQNRDRIVKERKTQEIADKVQNKIFEAKKRNPLAYDNDQDIMADPDVAANWDNFTVAQKMKIKNTGVRPTVTGAQTHASVEEMYMRGDFAKMDADAFEMAASGLGKDLYNSYRKKWANETNGYNRGLQKGRPDFKTDVKSLMKKDKLLSTDKSGKLTPAAQSAWTNQIETIVDTELDNLTVKDFKSQEERDKAIRSIYVKAKTQLVEEKKKTTKNSWGWSRFFGDGEPTPAAAAPTAIAAPTPATPASSGNARQDKINRMLGKTK